MSPISEARAGVNAIIPATIAMMPYALILGQQSAAKGLTPLEVLAMSSIVFAGSAQFLAVTLWTDPLPIAALALSVLVVNLRHVLMGASIASKIEQFGGWRWPAAFLLSDEHWAVAERRALSQPLTMSFWFGSAVFLYLNFLVVTVLGAIVGSFLQDPERYGFDFAFSAIFIVLVMGFWRGRRTAFVIAASAATATVVHALLPGAWYVIAGALAGVTAAVLAEPVAEDVAA